MRRVFQNLLGLWLKPGKPVAGTARPSPRPAPIGRAPWGDTYDRLGIPHTLAYPDTTLGRILDQTADRFGESTAIMYGVQRWTYHELLAQVHRMAAGLADLGVTRGDRVVLTLPNCPEFIVVFFAIQKLGAVVVNAGPLLGADDLCKLITMTDPRLLIGLDLQAAILRASGNPAAQKVPRLCVSLSGYQTMWNRLGYHYQLWQTQHASDEGKCELMYEQLMARAPARPPTVAASPLDVAVLQPTGGTSGTLKVAQLTHRNLLCNAVQVATWGRLRDGQESVLGVLPMFHAYGLTLALISPVLLGATMLPMTRFRLEQMIDVIRRYKPTVLPLVPAILHAFCDELEQHPRPDICQAIRGRMVLSGAAPLATAVAERFTGLTGVTVLQGYGLTEASPATHSNPPAEPRADSIGLPLPDTRCRVVDLTDDTHDVPAGEPGELLVSGPQVFAGYFNEPEQTRKMLSTDGVGRTWLHTGDVVRADADGYFYILDRKKEMINRGGEKVWPARVERVLMLHPKVADAAVLGRPDSRHTEIVVAIVAPAAKDADTAALTEELRKLCHEHLGTFEVPSVFEFIDRIPRSALGKLLKYQLREKPVASDATPPQTQEEAV